MIKSLVLKVDLLCSSGEITISIAEVALPTEAPPRTDSEAETGKHLEFKSLLKSFEIKEHVEPGSIIIYKFDL